MKDLIVEVRKGDMVILRIGLWPLVMWHCMDIANMSVDIDSLQLYLNDEKVDQEEYLK